MATRVLLCDDHRIFREGLRTLLEKNPGLSVVGEAGDGPGAVKKVQELAPDIVLMDLKMPGLDGDEVLRMIGELNPTPKVIFVTAYDDGGKTKARLLNLGAFACLDKPISSLKDLEETINKAAQK